MRVAGTAVLMVTAWMLGCTAAQAQGQVRVPPAASANAASYEQALRDADALIKGGKPEEAYALLQGLERDHAGETRFDYLLGVAALDSGKPDLATLALERALMSDPDFAGARLEMARAYYQLGDLLRAKVEFERVARQNPGAEESATVQKYLDAIAARDPAKATHYSGYIMGAAGHDSNVNNSTNAQQVIVNLPPIGPVVAVLNPTSLQTSDNYAALGAGGAVAHTLNPNWGLYGGADLFQRDYNTQKDFNSLTAQGRAGVIYGADAERVRLGMIGGIYTLGGRRNSDNVGANAEWGHTFSPRNQMMLFGQYQQYRFADPAMQVNDFNQEVAGAGWIHALADGQSLISGFVYYGAEQDVSTLITLAEPSGGRADGAKRLGGVKIGGQTNWGDRTTLYANAGWQAGNYSKVNSLFLLQRADRYYDLTAGASWHWTRSWSVGPQLAYSRNTSNIPIYSYSRADISLNLRRDFR